MLSLGDDFYKVEVSLDTKYWLHLRVDARQSDLPIKTIFLHLFSLTLGPQHIHLTR